MLANVMCSSFPLTLGGVHTAVSPVMLQIDVSIWSINCGIPPG